MLNYVAEEFENKHGTDPRDDALPYQELYERVLAAKISLSSKDRAMIPVNYRGKRMAVKLTRDVFEDITRDLVSQCEATANLVLDKAKYKWTELDDILLVGGATRMPMIRDMLQRLWGKPPSAGVNPDECVALGAALAGVFRHRPNHPALQAQRKSIQQRAAELAKKQATKPAPVKRPEENKARGAAIGLAYGGHRATQGASSGTGGSKPFAPSGGPGITRPAPRAAPRSDFDAPALPNVIIEDATTHPLGIIVLNKKREERVVELIPEGTKLPYEFRGRFAYAFENMTAVRVEVTEGSGSVRDEVVVIGKVELTGLPPRPRGTPIEVIYQYGIDQILKVQVVDVETGAKKDLALRFQGGLTAEQLAGARNRQHRMRVE